MAISKKIRFEVFKRDGFQCAYCGKTPPEITLEVDHIKPKSKKGKDDINNLITACFDCNRGKRNIELDKIPNKLNENLEILKEREEQLKEYKKFVISIRRRINNDIKKVENKFMEYFPDNIFTERPKTSIKQFLEILDIYTIIDAMELACLRINDSDRVMKYFYGICWNKIKGRKYGEE